MPQLSVDTSNKEQVNKKEPFSGWKWLSSMLRSYNRQLAHYGVISEDLIGFPDKSRDSGRREMKLLGDSCKKAATQGPVHLRSKCVVHFVLSLKNVLLQSNMFTKHAN